MLSAGGSIDSDAVFHQFDLISRGAVVAAVSGGGDSLALLSLLKDYLDRVSPATRLMAVTIDHGLRADSAAEAGAVAALCRRFGIGHRTLAWTGPKPSSGLPAAAREARYRLLADAAMAEGAEIVVTGHTFDDQLETIAMRRARGDGRGLSGMAPATLYDGCVWILRPLLARRRADLRAQLRERGIAWIEDPSNDDERYERARLRMTNAIAAEPGQASLQALIDTARRQRVELGSRAAALVMAHARAAGPGLVRLDRAIGSETDRDAAVYALRILLAATGGAEQLTDIVRATALFERLKDGNFRSTLSRTVIDARRDAVFLRRENRGLPAATSPQPGTIWDGRYRIGRLRDGVTIAAMGVAQAAAMLTKHGAAFPPTTPDSLARAALAVEPARWRCGICEGLAAAADPAGQETAPRIIAPWARFLPSFDLVPAKAAAALFGADIPPEPPFAGHKAGKG